MDRHLLCGSQPSHSQHVAVALTTDTQVSNLDSEQETPEMGSQAPDCEDPQVPINDITPDISNEEVVQVNETVVSSDQTPTNDKDDTSDPSLQDKSVKLPYVTYNLDNHKSIYIWKRTIVAYADKDEPEVDWRHMKKHKRQYNTGII